MKEEAKKTAVDNFIASIDTTLPIVTHFMNLEKDVELYDWNDATKVAIMRGILEKYEKFRAPLYKGLSI